MSDNNKPENTFILPPDLEKQKNFVRFSEKVLRSFRDYKPETALLIKLMRSPHDFIIYEFYAQNVLLDIAERFQAGITQKDRKICILFMSFIKMLYTMFTERQKAILVKKLIDEWQRFELDHSPYFETISTNFDEDLEKAVDTIYNSENPEEQVEAVKDGIRWAMLMSPPKVVLRLLRAAIYNRNVLPAALKLCRLIPELFYGRTLKIWHTPNELDAKEPLLKLVMCRLLADSRSTIEKSEHWEAVFEVAMSLCEKTDEESKPLMDQQDLLDLVLTELYGKNRSPMKSVEILTRLAAEILKPDNPQQLLYTFSGSKREQPRPQLFLTPTIIDLILELLEKYDGKSTNIVMNLKSMLKSIGERMWQCGVEFDAETRDYIPEKELPWYIQYSMSNWYRAALKVEFLPVPLGFYCALSEKESDFAVRNDEMEDWNPYRNYLTTLVELALFDVESASELLNAEIIIDLSQEDLVPLLEKAIQESYCKKARLSGVKNWEFEAFLKQIFTRLKPRQPKVDLKPLLKLIPEINLHEVVVPVPPGSFVKMVAIPALDEPLPDRTKWPKEPVKLMSLQELRRVQRVYRQRARDLQRKVDERYAKKCEDVRNQWVADGFNHSEQSNHWADRVEKVSVVQEARAEEAKVLGSRVVNEDEKGVLQKTLC